MNPTPVIRITESAPGSIEAARTLPMRDFSSGDAGASRLDAEGSEAFTFRVHRPSVDRPEWRQRLVDIEKGLATALRTDSTLFMHLFVDSMILAGGAVIGLHVWQWVALIGTLTVVLNVELLSQAIRRLAVLAHPLGEKRTRASEIAHQTEALCYAASFIAILGGIAIATLIFAQRIYESIPE